MPRLAIPGQAEVVERPLQLLAHRLATVAAATMRAPPTDRLLGELLCKQHRRVVLRSNRGRGLAQHSRMDAPEREEVGNKQSVEAQCTRAPLATLDGGVVRVLVRCRRVEQDEESEAAGISPGAPEEIAVAVARVEPGAPSVPASAAGA